MAAKCVHKGCGKVFSDPDEPCIYHPGPPDFHEGQKGWKCCKPRVLTFDEFLTIPPCTTGKHSTVDDTPAPESRPGPQTAPPPVSLPASTSQANSSSQISIPERTALPVQNSAPPRSPAPPPEEESDDPSASIGAGATCKRKGCNATYDGKVPREDEECVHHPGAAVFHEGSKGWSCCKRRVLEFEEFMKIEGCTKKKRHLFLGKGKPTGEEKVETVRTDFYQTSTAVIASLYLKKIDSSKAKVDFSSPNSIDVDLPTADDKRYATTIPLFGPIDTEASKYKIMGTKLEFSLIKADGASWPVFRSDDRLTGERIQVGKAGRVS